MQETHYEFNIDDELRKLGLLVGISKEMYYCSISRISTLYLENFETKWVAWRETYDLQNNKRVSYRTIADGSFELVAARTKNYLNYIKRKQGIK
ncbi:pathogenicity island protein [Staphylococcus epidermidis]|uniref:pathogenicity island protein n=1 Tax=Staphylococcus epidermidis TaxID=1282 RepID=UPI00138B157E|nr:pathogenicity island protein [Staphylococcus epidermidis]MCG3213548.1 pathogenicity island protein [Staphylococcus epidermidis]